MTVAATKPKPAPAKPKPAHPTSAVQVSVPTKPASSTATVTLSSATVSERRSGPHAEVISCAYPVLQDSANPAGADYIDSAMESTALKAVSDFEAYVAAEPVVPGWPDPATLTCTWTKAWLSPTLGSVSFVPLDFPAGAAHPTSEVTTFDFDPATGKLYSLPDLFQSGSDWVKVLMNEANALLPAVLHNLNFGPPFSSATAQPSAFDAFQITPSALVVTFQEYSVAPYAWGTPTIDIPLAALAAVANPNGPLGSL